MAFAHAGVSPRRAGPLKERGGRLSVPGHRRRSVGNHFQRSRIRSCKDVAKCDLRMEETMRRRDDRAPERRLIAGFTGAGIILFAGTLLVGFSARDIERNASPSVIVGPSTTAVADAAG